ncbi:MAG: hypothetical protein IRY85_20380 [Micromonosporaceae bacterium]|nr:hypothetical protein [Micromonosporaceae bacterium]
MKPSIEALEARIDELRAAVRKAVVARDSVRARVLRGELRRAEREWEEALAQFESTQNSLERAAAHGSLLPLREKVHHALTLLTVPAAPRLITAVHAALVGGDIPSSRLTSLRRDEERSFRSAPHSRPYYLCPALTFDRLAPARALLSISTWPIADRIVGPLSPRAQFLTAAIQVAEAIRRIKEPRPEAMRLLWRFAANIPGGTDGGVDPATVIRAARAELVIHQDEDRRTREQAARRADALTDVQRLFGVRLAAVSDVEEAG